MRVAVVINRLKEDHEILSRMGWFIDCRISLITRECIEQSAYSAIESCKPLDLILVCGGSIPYELTRGMRLIELPALDYHAWTDKARRFVGRLIREGTEDLEIRFDKRTGRLIVETLVPF